MRNGTWPLEQGIAGRYTRHVHEVRSLVLVVQVDCDVLCPVYVLQEAAKPQNTWVGAMW